MGVTCVNPFLGFSVTPDVLPTRRLPWCIVSPVLITDVPQVVGWPNIGPVMWERRFCCGLGRGCGMSGLWLGIPDLAGKLAVKPLPY